MTVEHTTCPHCGARLVFTVIVPEEVPTPRPSPTWPDSTRRETRQQQQQPANVVDMRAYGYKQHIERLDDEGPDERR